MMNGDQQSKAISGGAHTDGRQRALYARGILGVMLVKFSPPMTVSRLDLQRLLDLCWKRPKH
eukprot:2236391-Amphidinium_carterae.2